MVHISLNNDGGVKLDTEVENLAHELQAALCIHVRIYHLQIVVTEYV